jgi:hypothetical protein
MGLARWGRGKWPLSLNAARDLKRHTDGGPEGNDVNCRFQRRYGYVRGTFPKSIPGTFPNARAQRSLRQDQRAHRCRTETSATISADWPGFTAAGTVAATDYRCSIASTPTAGRPTGGVAVHTLTLPVAMPSRYSYPKSHRRLGLAVSALKQSGQAFPSYHHDNERRLTTAPETRASGQASARSPRVVNVPSACPMYIGRHFGWQRLPRVHQNATNQPLTDQCSALVVEAKSEAAIGTFGSARMNGARADD